MTATRQARIPVRADESGPGAPASPTGGDGDKRFAIGLVLDVARTIEAHGYGSFEGRDFVELQQHLLHLLHAHGAACTGGSCE